jgi:hypothetical protein
MRMKEKGKGDVERMMWLERGSAGGFQRTR